MPYSLVPDSVAATQAQGKPCLSSYDSGQETSLAHWLEVCRLVELAEREDQESEGYVFDDSCLLVSE
jgi:hypothetical protein